MSRVVWESIRTTALGFTGTDTTNRDTPCGVRPTVFRVDNVTAFMCRLSRNTGILTAIPVLYKDSFNLIYINIYVHKFSSYW